MSLPNEVIVSTSKLTAIGDAIRSRFGVSGDLTLDEMAYDVTNAGSHEIVFGNLIKMNLSNGYAINARAAYGWGKLQKSDFTEFIYNLNAATSSCRVVYRFKVTNSNVFSGYNGLFGDDRTGEPATKSIGGYFAPPNKLALRMIQSNNTGVDCAVEGISLDTWYYAVAYVDKVNSKFYASLYSDNGTLVDRKETTISGVYTNTSGFTITGGINWNNSLVGEIDLTDTCYLIDETEVWGKLNDRIRTLGIPSN